VLRFASAPAGSRLVREGRSSAGEPDLLPYSQVVAIDLFAGLRVSDFAAAREWYARLFGVEPSFLPHDTEAVWTLGDNRHVYVVEDADHHGGCVVTLFVDDLDARVTAIAGRGIESAEDETYSNGVRKVTYRDADGNEIGLGGPSPD
jgi:catechol 2,3-dioxygenase-like lactoylglutathione lyase family enzyme